MGRWGDGEVWEVWEVGGEKTVCFNYTPCKFDWVDY